jgi:hypothetical protein
MTVLDERPPKRGAYHHPVSRMDLMILVAGFVVAVLVGFAATSAVVF